MINVHAWLRLVYGRMAAHVSEILKNPNARRIFALKISLVSFLVGAATTTTIVAHHRLRHAEHSLFESRFNSVCDNAIISLGESLTQMNMNIRELSVTYGHIFPSLSQWPNSAWKGFHPTATLLSNISSIEGMGILPLVRPDQVQSYQDFISSYYNTDPYCDRFAYTNPYFPNGEIWNTANSSEYPPEFSADPFGNTTDSPYQILTPLSQYTFSSIVGPHGVGYNLHADPFYTNTIDLIITCAEGKDHDFASTSCGTISPAAQVPYPSAADPHPRTEDMIAVLLHPIFPADNQSALVGFAAGTFSWKALLTNIIPADVSDVDCVIEADDKVFTFCITRGVPEYLGEGSRHDSAYVDLLRRSEVLGGRTSVVTGKPYVVNFYPTREFERRYKTNMPLQSSLVLLCSFLFCVFLFGTYDFLRQREFDRNQAVLDTKRRFVRFISHEIRTPLNTVRLGMKLLEVEIGKLAKSIAVGSPADLITLVEAALLSYQHLADEIIESSESAVEVLNDLLNYDKIEVGTLKLDVCYFNVRDLVQKTVSAMQVQAQQKGITLDFSSCAHCADGLGDSLPPDLEAGDVEGWRSWTIIGDNARIGQVLRNLISNALKFTPADREVSISLTTSDATGRCSEKIRDSSPLYEGVMHVGTLFIAVKDSGAGLSPQQLSEICAEGVQFNANELQAGQGSGLGLFISKGIIEQHGGKLVVASEGLGKGVTFTVELPLFKIPTARDPVNSKEREIVHSARSPTMSTSYETHHLSAKHSGITQAPWSQLLVVDDSALNRKMMTRLLKSQSYTCEQAEDGEVAVRKYLEMVERGEPPDAILMDYEMPVMNGPSATARLRELGCACLIVGVTGNVLSQDVAYFKEMGADAVISKPIALEDFERLLYEHKLRFLPTSSRSFKKDIGADLMVRMKPPVPVGFVPSAVPAKIHPGQPDDVYNF